jgi:peptidoglycan/LPS O-acetylase OafA/YrhL
MTSWGYSWLAMFYAGSLVIAISESKGAVHRILCNPWLMRLGTLAYGTYLLHLPLIIAGRTVLKHLFASANAAWLFGGWSGVAITIVLSNLSWNYFEKPMLRRGHNYRY